MFSIERSPKSLLPLISFHGITDANEEILGSAGNPTFLKSMCDGSWNVIHAHMTFITIIRDEFGSP